MENSSKCFRPRQLTLWRRMSNHWNKQNRFWEPLHAEVIRLTIDIGKMCDRGWYHASEHFTKHLDMADGGTNVGTAHPSFLVCCLFPVCPQTDTAQLCKTQSDLCLRTPHLDQIGHESSIVFSLKQVSSWHHTWLRTRHLNIYTNTVALALSATCHVCRLPTRCFFSPHVSILTSSHVFEDAQICTRIGGTAASPPKVFLLMDVCRAPEN